MKEYLVERDGKYELIEAYHLDGGIEVPEGALCGFFSTNELTRGKISFAKHVNNKVYIKDARDIDWDTTGWKNWKQFIDYGFDIVWQRNPSLNDQCAEIKEVRQNDNVNNPEHYNKGGVECIDAIESSMTKEAFAGYLKGNIQKYMWRYEQKGGVESLKKAQWYLNKLVNLVEGGK